MSETSFIKGACVRPHQRAVQTTVTRLFTTVSSGAVHARPVPVRDVLVPPGYVKTKGSTLLLPGYTHREANAQTQE